MRRNLLVAAVLLLPLAVVLLLPKILRQYKTAEIAVAVVRHPREEVLVSGMVKLQGAAPFSIQTLRIEEPGKEPYRRLVSLDSDNRFDLTLNKPVSGNYRASLALTVPQSGESRPVHWLTTPVANVDGSHPSPRAVIARQYDRPRLIMLGGGCAVLWAVLLGFTIWAWKRPSAYGKAPAETSKSEQL